MFERSIIQLSLIVHIKTIYLQMSMGTAASVVSELPSVYIPRVVCEEPTEEMVRAVMTENGVGDVSHVDFVKKIPANGGTPYFQAFVYFSGFYTTETAFQLLESMQNCNMPYRLQLQNCYWLLLKNKHHRSFQKQQLMNGFQHFDQDLQRFYACLETQTALAKLYYSAATLTQQDHANIDEGDAQIEDLECSIQYYRDEMLSAQADLEFTATGVSH